MTAETPSSQTSQTPAHTAASANTLDKMSVTAECDSEATQVATEPPHAMVDQGGNGDWQRLDPNFVQAERVSDAIFIAVLAAIVCVAWLVSMIVLFSLTSYISWLIILGGLAFCALLGWWGWFYPQWKFDSTFWREIHAGFEIRHGVWWWHRIFIPRERIQHTDVIRGPLMRRFGIAKLVIYTAGSHNHEVTLEGLSASQAESLRQSLLPQSKLLSAEFEQ